MSTIHLLDPALEASCNESVDADSWTTGLAGDTASLIDVIALTVRNAIWADRYFYFREDVRAPKSKNRTFREFMHDWLDSDSDPLAGGLAEVVTRARQSPSIAGKLHTTGWIGGRRGKTLADIVAACEDAGTTIDDLVEALDG